MFTFILGLQLQRSSLAQFPRHIPLRSWIPHLVLCFSVSLVVCLCVPSFLHFFSFPPQALLALVSCSCKADGREVLPSVIPKTLNRNVLYSQSLVFLYGLPTSNPTGVYWILWEQVLDLSLVFYCFICFLSSFFSVRYACSLYFCAFSLFLSWRCRRFQVISLRHVCLPSNTAGFEADQFMFIYASQFIGRSIPLGLKHDTTYINGHSRYRVTWNIEVR